MSLSQSHPSADAGPNSPRSPVTRRSDEVVKTTNFHVTNALGTTLMTSDSIDLARAWVRRNIVQFPSIRVIKVTHTVERVTVYRPARPAFERRVA